MVEFPSSLEQNFELSSFEDSYQNAVLRSQMDAGAPKVRLRYSAVPEHIRGTLLLRGEDDYNTFISFWKDDLKYGTLPFTWKHPITEQQVTMRFRSMWRITAQSPEHYIVEMDLEILP